MKKVFLILCFALPLFVFSQSGINSYRFKVMTISTESDLKQNKTTLQDVMGIDDDMQFSNGFVVVKTKHDYSVIELKFKLNSNNFPVVGDIYKNVKPIESTE